MGVGNQQVVHATQKGEFGLVGPVRDGLGLDLHLQFEFRYSEHMHAAPASMMG